MLPPSFSTKSLLASAPENFTIETRLQYPQPPGKNYNSNSNSSSSNNNNNNNEGDVHVWKYRSMKEDDVLLKDFAEYQERSVLPDQRLF